MAAGGRVGVVVIGKAPVDAPLAVNAAEQVRYCAVERHMDSVLLAGVVVGEYLTRLPLAAALELGL